MNCKLIASDVDGTLLDSNGNLPRSAIDAINRCKEAGILFTLSTGRPIQGVRRFSNLFSDNIPVITYNGAAVLTSKTEEVIFSCGLSEESCRKIFDLGKKLGVTQIIWADNRLYTDCVNELSLKYRTLSDEQLCEIGDISQAVKNEAAKMLWIADPADMPEIEKRTKEALAKESEIHFCTSKPEFLEFTNSKVSKATALAAVCEYLKINTAEAVAIGDGFNDLPMLEYAGTGIAMGNAPQAVKDKCDSVTDDVDNDGFAKAILSLLKK